MKELQSFYSALNEAQQVVVKLSLIIGIFLCASFVDAHASLIFNF